MAGRGPAPKDPAVRRRRNADTVAGSVIVQDGEIVGPALEEQTGRGTWSEPTLGWWATWQSSAQAKLFLPTDWSRLGMLAYLVEQYFKRPSMAALSEIRLNEERLGATVVDRQRARMTVEQAEPVSRAGTDGNVVPIASARQGLRDRLSSS